ncbi:MAG: DedA family protein [Planctomycetes bacterium]|nr:DedA family protein [Planctomycetota bacterium]
MHRRVYDWVLHWADTPYGAIALFLLALAESSFFPVPPDVLLIALVLGARSRWWRLALICTAGSVVGGVFGHAIGAVLMDAVGTRIIQFYQAEAHFEHVKELYATYDYWIVFVAAFTPIPYKVFTITSGVMEMNLVGFVAVSAVGRGARFFIVAYLLYLFGQPMKRFIDRYFDWLSIALLILIVAGFAILSYF